MGNVSAVNPRTYKGEGEGGGGVRLLPLRKVF